jgi:carbon-monoxide dehydrogenase medium subunit
MKPAPFSYRAPTSVAEAVSALAELGDEAKVLAGGQSLVPMLALRLARPEHAAPIPPPRSRSRSRRPGPACPSGLSSCR